jgi:sigma-E factor negative regulatory protein RseA
MNDALKMQISAFIDGELPENEAELLLRRLNQDAAMRQQVAEYLAIGRYMRRDAEPAGMSELRGRIAAALGEELLPAAQASAEQTSRFVRPAIGVALAASVAVLALVGLRQSVLPEATEPVTEAAAAR